MNANDATKSAACQETHHSAVTTVDRLTGGSIDTRSWGAAVDATMGALKARTDLAVNVSTLYSVEHAAQFAARDA